MHPYPTGSMLPSKTVSPIFRVPTELAGMFADAMDMPTLCNWRRTCHYNYIHASTSLRRTLVDRVQPFIPYPRQFISIVTKHAAIFGGEIALSFILRHDTYRTTSLEIFTSNYQFQALCDAILDSPDFALHIDKHIFLTRTFFQALRRLISQTLVIHFSNGKRVYIHQSYTCSPSAPLSRTICTALSNYVTAYGFGCSHPELTFARRALLSDQELQYLSPHDTLSLNHLLVHRFSLAVSPTAWREYRATIDNGVLLSAQECWRRRFLCPNQGRYFGDPGSLVAFFDPLRGDERRCVENNITPFGPMVIWRLMSSFNCDDRCEYQDDILEQGVTSVPVLFHKDPFGELRKCVSNRSMRTFPHYRRFRRPRSLSL